MVPERHGKPERAFVHARQTRSRKGQGIPPVTGVTSIFLRGKPSWDCPVKSARGDQVGSRFFQIQKEAFVSTIRTLITATVLAAGCMGLRADAYDDAMVYLKKRVPSAKTGIVMCNPDAMAEPLKGLFAAAKRANIKVQLFRVDNADSLDKAKGIVGSWRPDFVMLLDQDPLLGAGSKGSIALINRAGMAGVFVVSCGGAMKG